MEKKDAWLLELYEGSGPPPDAESGSAEEADSLREMKDWLDARSAIRSARPDPEAVAAVLQAAAQHTTLSGARRDRPALSRKRVAWRAPRRIAVGAIAAMLAAFALIGLFRTDALAPASTDTESVAVRPAAPAPTETTPSLASPEALFPAGEAADRGVDVQPGDAGLAAASSPDLRAPAAAPPSETAPEPPASAVLAGASSAGAAAPLQSAVAGDEQGEDDALAQPGFVLEIPAWDDQSDVIYLQQRIQHIGDGVAGGWETPAAPLEMLPAGSGNPGLTPASERR